MTTVPQAIFQTRVRDDALGGANPFAWRSIGSDDVFKGKRVVLFALPGAFTPTCSTSHLPRYEDLHEAFLAQGVDEVVCLSVCQRRFRHVPMGPRPGGRKSQSLA